MKSAAVRISPSPARGMSPRNAWREKGRAERARLAAGATPLPLKALKLTSGAAATSLPTNAEGATSRERSEQAS